MQKLSLKVIALARKYLFHTRLGKSALATRVYERLFDMSAPDLTKPVRFREVSLYVDPSDKTCVPSIVAGYFEERELDLFEAMVGEAKVFFDVGANIGLYSVIGCAKSDQLVAYAFEPVLENQRLLERNVAAHGLDGRIFLQPVAVSDKQGKANVHMYQSGTHSLEFHADRPTREVETVTLDGFAEQLGRGPDILKIDVEGHERAVLEGAWSMLTEYKPTLFIEFIPSVQQDLDAFIARLGSLFATCFVIDEIARTVVEKPIGSLHQQRSCNLVLTTNPRHAEIVRGLVDA